MVTGTPGTKVNILISSTLFQTASNDSKSDIDFELRNCIEGEALVSKSCDECGQGTYNLIAGEECQDCPYSAKCLGKTEIYPKAGY